MSDSTAQHDYTPPPPATFLQPGDLKGYMQEFRKVANSTADVNPIDGPPAGLDGVQAPTDEVPADPPPAAGPTPLLEGTFAIFVTPEESIVVAYRPRGADADKHFVVPAFIVSMASQHSGHSAADILKALKEGL